MKLTNIIIREILLFLEFEDLADNRLELISKKFYHNIMEDNELLRRMLDNCLGMIKDYQREQEYQDSILDNRNATNGEHISDDTKKIKRKYMKIYDDSSSNSIRLFKSLSKRKRKLLTMCERSTAGHQLGKNNISDIFQGTGNNYNTCPEIYYPNGLMCITLFPYAPDQYNRNGGKNRALQAEQLAKIYKVKRIDVPRGTLFK
ncbi:unnamed protein product [Moneuplotes crassus]|uniref:F-box domain-containing protein n=1 Tax=Euplotes crassus TaxID=5936 RepID=A0AAD1Y996_EUPCR|nr:unnamed protein product [Moneuplotes crassus]